MLGEVKATQVGGDNDQGSPIEPSQSRHLSSQTSHSPRCTPTRTTGAWEALDSERPGAFGSGSCPSMDSSSGGTAPGSACLQGLALCASTPTAAQPCSPALLGCSAPNRELLHTKQGWRRLCEPEGPGKGRQQSQKLGLPPRSIVESPTTCLGPSS